MRIVLPNQIETALSILINNGYEAYIVGGCVRDILLGKIPKDYDITTNALPQQIITLFKNYHIIDKGLKHGTVTVIIDGMPIEITTYRIDGKYSDNRHPDNVNFTGNLKEDLKRRDFTINAIAYNHNHGIVDYFGGRFDIEKRIIKCVGEPDRRFGEDALRILRALRFSAELNFTIEENTARSIHKNKELLRNIAVERIAGEFSMILCAEGAESVVYEFTDVFGVFIPEIVHMKNFYKTNNSCKMKNTYQDKTPKKCDMYGTCETCDLLTHALKVVNNVPKDLRLKLAAFFHDIGKPFTGSSDQWERKCICEWEGEPKYFHKYEQCFNENECFSEHAKKSSEIAKDILIRLKYDNNTIDKVTKLILYHDITFENDERILKRWLNKLSEKVMQDIIVLKKAHVLGQGFQDHCKLKQLDEINDTIDKIITQKQCFLLKDLAVNGHDLIKLGIPESKSLGQILNHLLFQVIDGNLPNEKEALLKAAFDLYKNIQ
ncbi:MAG TPA: HD domain-containing protein [Clostridiaceae bacterium]|nr:HD domain-containing protein [Clostridiaceae bacterium]